MSLSSLFRSGGGNIQYLFHICGYPWAVCTSPALRDLLDSGDYDSYRRYVFGHAWHGSLLNEEYFADDTNLCPIFATLQLPGSQRWKVNEAKGRLEGGSFRVEIEDRPLGHTWQYGGSQSFWGLDGLHRIAQPGKDSITAYGTLSAFCGKEDTVIKFYEENASVFSARVTAGIAADGYYPIWVGQECIAVKAISTDGHELTLTVRDRGLFRSADQHHKIQEFGSSNPIVTDCPLSIVDKPCWLWAFALSNDDSSIITSPGIVRWGKVGTRVETKRGITRIDVLSPMSILDNDVKAPQFHSGYLNGYVLARNAGADNTDANCLLYRQSPHIVLREFTSYTDTVGTTTNIWLCPAGDNATFNTVQELYDKIDEEFGLMSTGDSTINDGVSSLLYEYSIEYGDDKSAPYLFQREKDGGNTVTKLSLMTGTVAHMLNLGDPYTRYETDIFIEFLRRKGMVFARWTVLEDGLYGLGKWLACISYEKGHDDYNLDDSEFEGKALPGKRVEWVAQYLYEWEWSSRDYLYNKGGESRRDFNMADNKLYFQRGTDISMIEASDTYMMGSPKDSRHRYGKFIVGTPYPDATYPYVNVGSEIHTVPGYRAPYGVGVPLFYIPALEGDSDEIYDSDDNKIERTDDDPWRVSGGKTIRTDRLHKAILTLLGSAFVPLPEYSKLYHVVGFTDVEKNGSYDHYSFIDWDDFEEKILPINTKHDYRVDIENGVNLYEIITGELVLHGYAPTLEYVDSKRQYQIRFRKIGPSNVTEAVNSGRVVTNNDIMDGQTHTDSHCDANIYSKMKIKLNRVEGESKAKINVDYSTGYQVGSNKSKKITIDAPLSHIQKLGSRNSIQTVYAYRHFEGLMRSFAIPNPQYRITCTGSMGLEAAVNREFLITDPTGFKPWTHEQGLSEVIALMTGIQIDLGQRGLTAKITARIDSEAIYGYAPACVISSGASKIGSNTITASASLHTFTSGTQRVDCMYFDCYTYNSSTGIYTSKGCNCGDYACLAIEYYPLTDDPDVLSFDVTSVSSDGSIELVDVSGGASYTAFDTAKYYMLIFDTYDNCEACQQKYVCLADSDNTIGSDNIAARRFV